MVSQLHTSVDMGLLLALVLKRSCDVEVLGAEEYQLVILLKELGAIKVEATVVALLIKVHGTNLQLDVFKVRSDIHNEVVSSHVAKQTYETTLVKLHQFFGNPDRLQPLTVEPLIDKHISWNPHDVFFSQSVMVGEVVHAIG